MTLQSKNPKSSAGTLAGTGNNSNSQSLKPTEEMVGDVDPQMARCLEMMNEVKEGWTKLSYSYFTKGLHVLWEAFKLNFKNITWARKYLDEGAGTQVKIITII